jgi:16S rRNA processing protein RimM
MPGRHGIRCRGRHGPALWWSSVLALVLIAELGRPHGVRGWLRVRSFSEMPLEGYNPLRDQSGRGFVLLPRGPDIVAVEGVEDRDAAARLTGTKLYIDRERLPAAEEDEFYLADLVGLAAAGAAGEAYGKVLAVEDHGGGPYLVLSGPPERLVPFTRAAVPVVDVAGGRLVVEPPAELNGEAPP